MELHKGEKLKFFPFLFGTVGIALICLICLLSLLDAPEYVHCNHRHVCEFLELSGNLNAFQEAGYSRTVVQKMIICPYLFLWSEGILYRVTTFLNRALSVALFLISRYIGPFRHQRIFLLPHEEGEKISIDQEHVFCPSMRNCLPSQALQIIATTIITS
ncbi:MAG: hypothetical protein AB1847_04000 [bacterium]